MSEQKRFLSISDLTHLPKPHWLIEGLFEQNAQVMLYGPPGAYKSFMALDWLLCMASGRKWNDRATTPAKVLYILGEGRSSLLKRVQAWVDKHSITEAEQSQLEENFRVSFEVPQMALKASVDNMLAQLEAENFKPGVIAIDTFARSFVGLDENSQRDTGLWIEQAERLRNLGYTVIFVHHTAKNQEFGLKYRGSTVIMGAMDTAIAMERDKAVKTRVLFTITKQKDHDEGEPLSFQALPVNPGPDGQDSVVLSPMVATDSRFTPEAILTEKLIKDDSFENDTARGQALAEGLGVVLSSEAGRKRIKRYRKANNLPEPAETEGLSPETGS